MNLPADNRSAPPSSPAAHGRPLRLTVPIQAMGSAILQVVVVWRGRIVGYRLLSQRQTITIGPGHTWWLAFPAWLPYHKYLRRLVPDPTFDGPRIDGRSRFPLIKPGRGGGYRLRLTPALRGEVQLGGETRDLADVMISAPAVGKGDVREVVLAPGDRAKLFLAESPDLKIEIRWVDPPEILAKPKIEDPAMFQTLVGTAIIMGLAAAA